MNLNEKKVLFADLDGTLITTASGKTFADSDKKCAENFGLRLFMVVWILFPIWGGLALSLILLIILFIIKNII